MAETDQFPARSASSCRLLFVHSGSAKKRLTFECASRLDIHSYLLNPDPNWAVDYAVGCVFTRGRSLPEVVAAVQQLDAEVGLDGVVTFWEEDVPTCSILASHLGLPGNTLTAAFNARSKYRMRRALQRAGVPVPAFRLVDSPEAVLDACRAVGTPAVLKPEWGSDSEWVARVDTPQQALDVYCELRPRVRVQDCIYPYRPRNFVLEGMLTGPEVSVEGVVQNGEVTLYATIDKAKMDEDTFIERGERTPSLLPPSVQQAVRAAVRDGARAWA